MNDIDLDIAAERFCGGGWKWPLLILVLAGLVLTYPEQAGISLWFVLDNMLAMTPVIGFAVLATASIRASGADGLLHRLFEGRMTAMIVAASLFGAITPICGIGVLPIIAGLLSAGVPLAPVMAFWLSSPITDPAMLAITAGTLGIDMAIGKTLIAVFVGLLGGAVMILVTRSGLIGRPLKAGLGAIPGGCGDTCEPAGLRWTFWKDASRRRMFRDDALASLSLMIKWLAIAFLVESLITSWLPPEWIAGLVGADNAWAIPVAVLVGAPIYLDGYASLPMVRGLMDLGMTPGAAMGFLVAGGITSLYASVAVYALVRVPVFLLYIGLAVTGSLIGAYGFDMALRFL